MKEQPVVSIIIPTKNSAVTLDKVLNSIKKQTYPNIEVIIVDRFSKDCTLEIARKHGACIHQLNSERTAAVNYAGKVARGTYLYYIGSDYVLVDENLVEEIVKTVKNANADAAIVTNTVDPNVSFWAKVRYLEKSTYVGDPLIEAARFFSKVSFFAVGGYDENMVAYEEHDLHNRLLQAGMKVIRVPNVKEVHIGEPKTLSEIARKYHYYGKTMKIFIDRNPRKGWKQLSPIRPAFLRNWKEFTKHPMLTIGFIIYQMVRYSAAGLGFLVS